MVKGNKDTEYVVIKKSTLENIFFITLLCVFLIIFVFTLIRGFTGFSLINIITGRNNNMVNLNNIGYFEDVYLNVRYPCPGGNWGLAEIEDYTDTLEAVITSMGSDGLYDFTRDALSEEILSSMFFNDIGKEGYRQFISYTFKPDPGYDSSLFLDYCQASFYNDMENTEGYEDYELLSAELDSSGGALMKMKMTMIMEYEDGESETIPIYYTQYIKDLGVNFITCTFGSTYQDNDMDVYLQFFCNNVVSDTSIGLNNGIILPSFADILDSGGSISITPTNNNKDGANNE